MRPCCILGSDQEEYQGYRLTIQGIIIYWFTAATECCNKGTDGLGLAVRNGYTIAHTRAHELFTGPDGLEYGVLVGIFDRIDDKSDQALDYLIFAAGLQLQLDT